MKKTIKAWVVFRDENLPLATILEQDGECPCQSNTYTAIPLFKTKKEANQYTEYGQKVVQCSITYDITSKKK